MFTFIISFILLKRSGTQKVLYYDSQYGWRGAHGLVVLAGGKGSAPYTKGRQHWDSPRNILQTRMVFVLVPCHILEMLADYQIIKLLMMFKT